MATRRDMCLWTAALVFIFGPLMVICVTGNNEKLQYCPFFNNRAPKTAPNLKNCTWFKDNSCCLQQEIEATFGRVKPLQGASVACQRYINYLMCYICAPNQNLFYERERLTVCEEFCDALYDACNSAILKGSVIKKLYPNGKEFCASRRFNVDKEISGKCFAFDASLDSTGGANTEKGNVLLLLTALMLFCLTQIPVSRTGISMTTAISKKTKLSKLLSFKRKKRKCRHTHCVEGACAKLKLRMSTVKQYINCSLVFPWLPSVDCAVFVVMLFILSTSQGVDAVTADDVKTWAKIISTDFHDLAKKGLQYEEIQRLYDKAQYTTEYINGINKILEVRKELGTFFSKKRALAEKLAGEVESLHDRWLEQQQQLQNSNHSNNSQQIKTLKNLPRGEYQDADLAHTLPLHSMKYNRDFKAVIAADSSFVKIPDEVPRSNKQVVDTVSWTAGLDPVFRNNRRSDTSIRWQYFASNTGVHRSYPGREWKRNFVGFSEDYDPRTRPWYVSATSGPKDIVIVLDGSESMETEGSMGRLKQVALALLNTLTKQDFVNVIVSRSYYWDKSGVFYNFTSHPLSCRQDELVPASASYRRELSSKIKQLKPEGGSNHDEAFRKAFHLLKTHSIQDNCQSFIIFITDGQDTDADQRCKQGYFKYDESNKKHYVPGHQCQYDFEKLIQTVNLLQYKLSKRAHLFTFLTQNKADSNKVLPGELACDNQGAMAEITSDTNTFQQMAPYFSYLEASSGARHAIWSSPYLDDGGLGLMVTVAVPVYSNATRRHLGVVGLDIPLSSIETILLHETWGSTYAFLIDIGDGSAIIHPFSKPSAQLIDDPAFIPITELETHNGQPENFSKVVDAMRRKKTGHIKIVRNALRAVFVHDSLSWRPTDYSHYFFTHIPDSDFAFAFNLGKADETFQFARDPPGMGPVSYLHQMRKYINLTDELPGVYRTLNPSSQYSVYPGMEISKSHSVVALALRSFCDPMAYLEDRKPTFLEVHKYINTFIPSYEVNCPQGTYSSDVRPDVKLTAKLEALWLGRDSKLQNKIAWTYTGTMGGVMRVYPGVELSQTYDPTTRPWYNRAVVNRGQLAISCVYSDSSPGVGKVVTLSRAIHQAKPLTPPDCTGSLRDYGCPCETNDQCKSGYCYVQSCADDIIQAVVGLDIRYRDFQQNIKELMSSSGIHHHCGQRYSCDGGFICETRCYILEDSSHLALDPDFILSRDSDRSQYEEVSLAAKEGYIFSQLLQQGIFNSQSRMDYQGVCKFSEDIPEAYPGENMRASVRRERGPFPSFQNQYGCIKEVTYYTANQSHLEALGGMVSGSLDDDPCSSGHFYFTGIPGTNVYLLAISNYHKLNNFFNFNCHIRNTVLAPGSFKVIPNTCSDYQNPSSFHEGRCLPPKKVLLPCGYSLAPSPIASCNTLYFLTFYTCIVLLSYSRQIFSVLWC